VKRHVTCFVEKAWFEPRTLGTKRSTMTTALHARSIPYSSTLAMHAQSNSGGRGKLIVMGFINAEDNKATEQKTEQAAPASSPGLVHHPKMGARSYTLLSVLESPTNSNSGPAGPIAVNAPAAKIWGFRTCSKDTSMVDHSSGRMSLSAAGVAGKPRTQRPGKSAD
jgi:hypothetical protein